MSIFTQDTSIQMTGDSSLTKTYNTKDNPNLAFHSRAGIYNSANNTIKIFTNNIDALTIDANQKVICNGSLITNLSWGNIDGKPTVFTTNWDNVNGKPTIFATNWDNVAGKPTIFATNWDNVAGKPTIFATNWDNVASKPTNFQADWSSTVINRPNELLNISNIFVTSNVIQNTQDLIAYSKLAGRPPLAMVATSGLYGHLSGTPSLATVATSGLYSDLSGIPTNFQSDWNSTVINKPSLFDGTWTSLSGKPTNFQADWLTTVTNRPTNFQSDWNSTVINRPDALLNISNIFVTSNVLRNSSNLINYSNLSNIPNLSLKQDVITVSNPIIKTGNALSLSYDSTLTLNGTQLSVASSASSQWTTSGTNIYNNNTGNVGINVTAPKQKLDIYGGNAVIRSTTEAGSAILYLGTPFNINSSGFKSAIIAEGQSTWSRSKLHFCMENTTTDAQNATISDACMTILSDGKIGIGTNNPQYQFNLHGKNMIGGFLYMKLSSATTGNGSGQGYNISMAEDGTSYLWNNSAKPLIFGTANTERFRISDTGNVGIGVNSSQILQVGAGGRLRISNGISDYSLIGTIDTDGVTNTRIVISGRDRGGTANANGNIEYVSTGTAGKHIFYTTDSTTERFRINNSGGVNVIGDYYDDGRLIQDHLFNNLGRIYATFTDFNAPTDFGCHFIRASTNSPNTNSSDYYEMTMGLGSDYTSGTGRFALQLAYNRFNEPYLSMRRMESGSWAGWQRVYAGYADSAGNLSGNPSISVSGLTTSGNISANFYNGKVNFISGEWNISSDGKPRMFFATNSHSYWGSYNNHIFRNYLDADVVSFDSAGNITAGFQSISVMNTDFLGIQINMPSIGSTTTKTIYTLYNTFTGSHRCFIEDPLFDINDWEQFRKDYEGRVIISTGKIKTHVRDCDEYKDWTALNDKEGILIEDALPIIELSRQKKDKRCYGVLGSSKKPNSANDRMIINGCGEGAIWVVNSNGNIENGDLLQTSVHLGYAERADDDLIRNYTIGKVVMDCYFQLDSPYYKCEDLGNGLKRAFLACVYMCS